MTEADWRPIESLPLHQWVWVASPNLVSTRTQSFGSRDQASEMGWTHWMPVPGRPPEPRTYTEEEVLEIASRAADVGCHVTYAAPWERALRALDWWARKQEGK